MSSRKQRKRYRRRLTEATAKPTRWDWAALSIDDCRLVRKAFNLDWDVPPENWPTIARGLVATAESHDGDAELFLAALRAILAADWADLRRKRRRTA